MSTLNTLSVPLVLAYVDSPAALLAFAALLRSLHLRKASAEAQLVPQFSGLNAVRNAREELSAQYDNQPIEFTAVLLFFPFDEPQYKELQRERYVKLQGVLADTKNLAAWSRAMGPMGPLTSNPLVLEGTPGMDELGRELLRASMSASSDEPHRWKAEVSSLLADGQEEMEKTRRIYHWVYKVAQIPIPRGYRWG